MDPIILSNDYTSAEALAGATLLTGYDEIAEVLRSRKYVQSGYVLSKEDFMRDVLITLDNEPHLARRRVLSRMFDDHAIATFRDLYVVPVSDRSIAELAALPRAADGSVETDLVPLIQRCLYRLGGAVAGIDGLDDPVVADRFVQQILAIGTGLVVDWSKDGASDILDRAKAGREAFRTELYGPSYARRKELVAKAKAAGEKKLPLHDSLTLMLMHQNEGWGTEDALLERETYTFLTAATQTTANALTWFILRLERWLGEHPEDRRLIAEDPEFLRRGAYDSLRLTVTAPWRMRTATEDHKLSTGREVKAGEKMALLFIPANISDPRFGAGAEDFDPHRKVEGGIAPWGHAFGGGAHMCLGRPLVTGSRVATGATGVDGTLVSIARRFYAAGLELDRSKEPVRDNSTWFQIYSSVPVRFRSV